MSARSKREINREREAIIAQALDTPEGRASLAQVMVEPLRRSSDYAGIGRRFLMVDELPQGAYAHYTSLNVSSYTREQITEEENILNDYLAWNAQNKLIDQIDTNRKNRKNAIFELEL